MDIELKQVILGCVKQNYNILYIYPHQSLSDWQRLQVFSQDLLGLSMDVVCEEYKIFLRCDNLVGKHLKFAYLFCTTMHRGSLDCAHCLKVTELCIGHTN